MVSNFKLTQEYKICKIGDFGLAKVKKSEKELETTLNYAGTPKYIGIEINSIIAPEVMQGEFGKKSDIFSLGKINI
jgi:serine/threonine protein kinase